MSEKPRLEKVTEGKIQQKRKMPRIALSQEQFRLSDNGKIFSVINLSLDGLALKVLETKDSFFFPIGREVSGHLKIEEYKIPLKLKVVHIDRHFAGCQFENIEKESLNTLKNLLNPKYVGERLKLMPSYESQGFWYHGPFSTEVVIKKNKEGKNNELLISVLGSFLQWGEKKGLSTGISEDTADLDAESSLIHINPLTVIFDDSFDHSKLILCRDMLAASPLSSDLKAWCLQKLEL